MANLNTEYAFDQGVLVDYRNLAFLEEEKLSFGEYIQNNQIEYILYPEEMDFIYTQRPMWNMFYGNVYPYYEDLQAFLSEQCVLVEEFNTPYAMRIVRFADAQDWALKIYRVRNEYE